MDLEDFCVFLRSSSTDPLSAPYLERYSSVQFVVECFHIIYILYDYIYIYVFHDHKLMISFATNPLSLATRIAKDVLRLLDTHATSAVDVPRSVLVMLHEVGVGGVAERGTER